MKTIYWTDFTKLRRWIGYYFQLGKREKEGFKDWKLGIKVPLLNSKTWQIGY